MTCDQTIRRLASYLDGEISQSERNAVEKHLDTCPECREALEALRGTLRAADAWKVEGGDIVNAVIARIALETPSSENANPAVLALLNEMSRDLRELRAEVAALRTEIAAQKGAAVRMTYRTNPWYREPGRSVWKEEDPWNCVRS